MHFVLALCVFAKIALRSIRIGQKNAIVSNLSELHIIEKPIVYILVKNSVQFTSKPSV